MFIDKMCSHEEAEPESTEMSEMTAEEEKLLFPDSSSSKGNLESLSLQVKNDTVSEAKSVTDTSDYRDAQDSTQNGDVSMANNVEDLISATSPLDPAISARETIETSVQGSPGQRKPQDGPVVRGIGIIKPRWETFETPVERGDSTLGIPKPITSQTISSEFTPEQALAQVQTKVLPLIEGDEGTKKGNSATEACQKPATGKTFKTTSIFTAERPKKPEPSVVAKPGGSLKDNKIQQSVKRILANEKMKKQQGTSKDSIAPTDKSRYVGGASTPSNNSNTTLDIQNSASNDSRQQGPQKIDAINLHLDDTPDADSSSENDHAWMEIQENEIDDRSKQLLAQIDALMIRNRNGKITPVEKLKLSQLKQRHKQNETRNGLGQRGDSNDEEDSMFVRIGESLEWEQEPWHLRTSMQDDEPVSIESFSEAAKETTGFLPNQITASQHVSQAMQQTMETNQSAKKKPRRKPAKDAREVHERKAQDKLDKQRKKDRKKAEKEKEKTKAKSYGISKNKSLTKGKGRKGAAKNSKQGSKKVPARRMRNFPNSEDLVGRELLSNLAYSNALTDRAVMGNMGEAPTINANTHKAQWEQLLACVPPNLDFHKLATDKSELRNAAKNFGFKKIKAQDGKWLLKGMKTPLYNHQLLASDWMIARECGDIEPRGGINADGMGLGKTIEMLATIIGHPPTIEDRKSRHGSTLIVVPSSVIQQWYDEIRAHVKEEVFPCILRYRASQGLEKNTIASHEIVITSYSEVIRSYPYPNAEQCRKLGPIGLSEWLGKQTPGPLHHVEWHRVCLDEAHAIKNHLSKTSIACQQLRGKYRWALSGTPITNCLQELFSCLRFIRAPYSRNFYEFQNEFCNPEHDDCNSRLAVLLGTILIRRTFKDKLLGRPIIDLPQPHSNLKNVKFSRQEQVLYRIVESCFRATMNQHLARGTAARNYGVFFVQLLRLRQLTNHPYLIEQTIKDIFSLGELRHLEWELQRCSKNKTPLYEQIQQWAAEKAVEGKDEPEKVAFGRADYGTYFEMGKYLEELPEEELVKRLICHICGDVPSDPQISDCGHVFCHECIRNYVHQQAASLEAAECPRCRRMMNNMKPYNDLRVRGEDDDINANGTDSQSAGQSRGRSEAKGKGKQNATKAKRGDKNLFSQGRDDLGWEPRTPSHWLDIANCDKEPLPSAKTIALKAELLRIFHNDPEDKVLIFTQFRVSARIIGRICHDEGWGFVYFTGDMSMKQRDEAVKRFHGDDSTRIMIAGLKCGGVALNLTCANRVISLDLWWNHSVEQQAFGRVFRIGQKKETHFTRLVVANSVDQRMLQMQAEKLKTIERAMQDDGRPIKALSMKEIASLFGAVTTDSKGNIQVEEDYDDGDDAHGSSHQGGDAMDEDGFSYTSNNATGSLGVDNGFRRDGGSGTQRGSGIAGEVCDLVGEEEAVVDLANGDDGDEDEGDVVMGDCDDEGADDDGDIEIL